MSLLLANQGAGPPPWTINALAISSAESFGLSNLVLNSLLLEIGSTEAFGLGNLTLSSVLLAIASTEGFGNATLVLNSLLQSIASSEAWGLSTWNWSGVIPTGEMEYIVQYRRRRR